MLRNDSNVDRRDVEIRCRSGAAIRSVAANRRSPSPSRCRVNQRGVTRDRPVRAAHALSLRLVSRMDLCARLADHPCRAGPAGQPNAAGSAGGQGERPSRSESRGEEDFSGLRAYEPGVPLKHMAWKVLARGGEAAGPQLHGTWPLSPNGWSGLRSDGSGRRGAIVAALPVGAGERGRATALRTANPGHGDCAFPRRRSSRRLPAGPRRLWHVAASEFQEIHDPARPRRPFHPSRPGRGSRPAPVRTDPGQNGPGASSARGGTDMRDGSPTRICWAFPPVSPWPWPRTFACASVWVLATTVPVRRGAPDTRAQRARRPAPRPAAARFRGRDCAAVRSIPHLQRLERGYRTAGAHGRSQAAGDRTPSANIYIITLIIYFVSISALLEGDSFLLLAYLIGVLLVDDATLLRLTTARPAPAWRGSLRYAGGMLAQALPVAVILWLLFPRFDGVLAALAHAGRWPHRGFRPERFHESRRHRSPRPVRRGRVPRAFHGGGAAAAGALLARARDARFRRAHLAPDRTSCPSSRPRCSRRDRPINTP